MPPYRKPPRKEAKGSSAAQKRTKPRKKPTGKKGAPPRKKPAKKPFQAPRPTPKPNEEAHRLALRIGALVSDKKGEEVVVLDVRGLTSYADYFVVASGESERQVAAMAEHVRTTLKQDGKNAVGTEGEQGGNWVLLDYGEVVTHLFFSETRGFYDLEGLWADAPREKVG